MPTWTQAQGAGRQGRVLRQLDAAARRGQGGALWLPLEPGEAARRGAVCRGGWSLRCSAVSPHHRGRAAAALPGSNSAPWRRGGPVSSLQSKHARAGVVFACRAAASPLAAAPPGPPATGRAPRLLAPIPGRGGAAAVPWGQRRARRRHIQRCEPAHHVLVPCQPEGRRSAACAEECSRACCRVRAPRAQIVERQGEAPGRTLLFFFAGSVREHSAPYS